MNGSKSPQVPHGGHPVTKATTWGGVFARFEIETDLGKKCPRQGIVRRVDFGTYTPCHIVTGKRRVRRNGHTYTDTLRGSAYGVRAWLRPEILTAVADAMCHVSGTVHLEIIDHGETAVVYAKWDQIIGSRRVAEIATASIPREILDAARSAS